MRARGLNFSASGGAIGSIVTAQVWPVGLDNIGSKIYFYFMSINFACAPVRDIYPPAFLKSVNSEYEEDSQMCREHDALAGCLEVSPYFYGAYSTDTNARRSSIFSIQRPKVARWRIWTSYSMLGRALPVLKTWRIRHILCCRRTTCRERLPDISRTCYCIIRCSTKRIARAGTLRSIGAL